MIFDGRLSRGDGSSSVSFDRNDEVMSDYEVKGTRRLVYDLDSSAPKDRTPISICPSIPPSQRYSKSTTA